MNEGDSQPLQASSQTQEEQQKEKPAEESKEPSNEEPQQVKPRGTLSEGKGRRFSLGKRGKVLSIKKGPEKDEDSTKKRRGSAAITPKERAQKRGKVATRQNSVSQKSDDGGSKESESKEGKGSKEETQKQRRTSNKKIDLSPKMITEKCTPVLQELMDDQFGWVFREAVDPVALGLPDYFDVVKTPMHLELVKKKLESSVYSDMELFARDTRLVFENAILYNGESSEVGELAQSMLNSFKVSYDALVQDIESSCTDEGEGDTLSIRCEDNDEEMGGRRQDKKSGKGDDAKNVQDPGTEAATSRGRDTDITRAKTQKRNSVTRSMNDMNRKEK